MDISEAESEFQRLKAQFDAGQITEDEFKARVEELRVEDENGRWWTIGRETGQWYVYEDDEWVQRDPPPAAPRTGGLIGGLPAIPQPALLAAGGLGAVLVIAVLLAILSPRSPDVAVISPMDAPTPTSTTTVKPTPTRTAIATPTITHTSTLTHTPSGQAASPSGPPSCEIALGSSFNSVWRRSSVYTRLGCPTTAEHSADSAVERFERGFMLWRSDRLGAYIVYYSGTWFRTELTYDDGFDPEFSCGDPPLTSPPYPRRGFSKVWCFEAGVRSGLGWALEAEQGYCMPGGLACESFQDFERGMMYRSNHDFDTFVGGIFVLYDDGGWERYP